MYKVTWAKRINQREKIKTVQMPLFRRIQNSYLVQITLTFSGTQTLTRHEFFPQGTRYLVVRQTLSK